MIRDTNFIHDSWSTFAKTLGRCMFLKNQTTTPLKAYLWFATNTPAKNEQLALYS